MNNGRRRNRSDNSRYNLRPRRQANEEPEEEPPAQRRRVAGRRGRAAAARAPAAARPPARAAARPPARAAARAPPARRAQPAPPPAPPVPPRRFRARIGVANPLLNPLMDRDNRAHIVLEEYLRDRFDSDHEEEEEASDDEDDESEDDSTFSNESGDPIIIEDEEDEEDEEIWNPFIPFNMAPDNFNNFFDIFRRIASGFSSNSYRLDTLPLPLPPSEDKIDLFNGNLPHHAHIAIHRSYLIPPFTNLMVDSVPSDIHGGRVNQRKHIFLTNYTRSSWNGLQNTAKKLRTFKSTIWCTEETARQIRIHHPPLWIEIQEMVSTLVPGKLYQVLPEDSRDRFSVLAVPLDTIPGSCMFLLAREGKFLLHTGTSAGQHCFELALRLIQEHAPRLDVLYLDSALYYPARDDSFKANLELQEVALTKVKQWISHVTADGSFVTVLFHNGMEKLFLGLVAALRCKVGITEDLHDVFYGELLPFRERVRMIPHLGRKELTSETREERVFFYTEGSAEYHQIHTTNSRHTRLFIVYDLHSCLERVENPVSCRGTVFRKTRRRFHGEDGEEEEDEGETEEDEGTFYALYPMHPNTVQVRSVIKTLKPERIFGLATAPGVGFHNLRSDFNTQIEENTRGNRPSTRARQRAPVVRPLF